jgi:hypothetical protein
MMRLITAIEATCAAKRFQVDETLHQAHRSASGIVAISKELRRIADRKHGQAVGHRTIRESLFRGTLDALHYDFR